MPLLSLFHSSLFPPPVGEGLDPPSLLLSSLFTPRRGGCPHPPVGRETRPLHFHLSRPATPSFSIQHSAFSIYQHRRAPCTILMLPLYHRFLKNVSRPCPNLVSQKSHKCPRKVPHNRHLSIISRRPPQPSQAQQSVFPVGEGLDPPSLLHSSLFTLHSP